MSDYSVRFVVNLIPALKPEGWPNPVYHDVIFRVEDFQSLRSLVDQQMLKMIQQNGVVIMKETKKPLTESIESWDLRRFVPLHMVAFINTETSLLTSVFPESNTEGVIKQ
ncbi:MAG: hypothetical protein OK457_05230 [Thaumarchaeota archaeon]|nr:hypothetical protein [Nitrososphaerota archaeon]